jgi:cell division protein ZapA (FtsZ GTPase activity inhibitor)
VTPSAKRTVSVRISGKEYRIRSDADEASLQRIARYVDDTMERIKQRTGAVDSVEVALLTALNAARELDDARGAGTALPPPADLRGLIERIEAAVDAASPPRA